MVAWRSGDEAGLLLGDASVAWPVAQYPRGVITPWVGKGGGRIELCGYRNWPPAFVVLEFAGCEDATLNWLLSRMHEFERLFPEGIHLGGTIVDA